MNSPDKALSCFIINPKTGEWFEGDRDTYLITVSTREHLEHDGDPMRLWKNDHILGCIPIGADHCDEMKGLVHPNGEPVSNI